MFHVSRSILVPLAALGVLVTALSACEATSADPDIAVAQAVAVDTILAGQKVGVLPGVGVGTVLTAAQVDRIVKDAAAAAMDHYAGPLLANRLEQFKAAAGDAAHVGARASALDGGVKDIQMGQTTIRGVTATVRLRATIWLKGAQGDNVSTPTGTADFAFELAKIDGRWYVTAESFDYLPGQGP